MVVDRLWGMATMTMAEVIAWLDELLPSGAPELWASLQPGATDHDLELLREAVEPLPIPSVWTELLRWRNGGSWGGPWWPVIDSGHLLGVSEAIDHYRWLCDNVDDWAWHRSWIPITHDSWNQCGVEAGTEETGLVLDGSFPDPPRRVAPSLVALLHAVCATIEAGVPSQPDEYKGPKYETWRARRDAVVTATYEEYGPWTTMTVHAHALLPQLKRALTEDRRVVLLDGPVVQSINREEQITFAWLERDGSSSTETSVRTNACAGLPIEEAVERIVNGLFEERPPRSLFAERPPLG